MNAFSIVGKITEMPILKETTNGLKTCELPVRVQRNFPNSDGVYENDDMVIEVWRGLAETVSASCKIGDYVGINGRIHSRKYQKDEKVYLNYGFVAEKIEKSGWGALTASESGRIGGMIRKRNTQNKKTHPQKKKRIKSLLSFFMSKINGCRILLLTIR